MNVSSKKPNTTLNLLELRPARNLQYESKDGENVVLLVPKFQSNFAKKWLLPYMRKKVFHVKLDQYGSFIWTRCDGTTSIADISEMMKSQYGADFDPTLGRIQRFIQMFLKDKFLVLPESTMTQ